MADHATGVIAQAESILQGLGFGRPVGKRAGAIEVPHGPRAAFAATVREVESELCEQPIVHGIRSLRGLKVARFQKTSTSPRRLISVHDCGLTAPGSDYSGRVALVGSGDSPHVVCGLFRMSGGLTSGGCAQRYYGLARMRRGLRRWTLCVWERMSADRMDQ